jgi:hypothetical protein
MQWLHNTGISHNTRVLGGRNPKNLLFAWIYPMDFAKMPENAVAA